MNSLSASGSCWKLFQTFLGQNGSENIVSVTSKACKPQKRQGSTIERNCLENEQRARQLLKFNLLERERASHPAPRTRVSLRVLLSRDFSRFPQNRNLVRRLVEV